jgi:arginine decarboxylase
MGAGATENRLIEGADRERLVPATAAEPARGATEAPYLEALGSYAAREAGRFHVPAHKGGSGAAPGLARFLGQALALDIPACTHGIDIGPEPTPLRRAEALAAHTWGARRTWFLVNGATEASHAACLALAHAGDQVVVQRNVHSSTIHGLVLAGMRPVFALPELDPELGIAHCVGPGALAAALDRSPAAVAAFVVSPTYFGACADVRALAEVSHDRGVPLIVDEAWGAHFHFHDRLPEDALTAGADLVISGSHKLIGSLTQSAMLHLGRREWPQLDEPLLSRAFGLVRTTSPSSLLLGSLDGARAHVAAEGAELAWRALQQMDLVKQALRDVCGLDLLDLGLTGRYGIAAFDPLRLAIDLRRGPQSGHALAAALRHIGDIHLELVTDRILLAHFGLAEPILVQGMRLVEALRLTLDLTTDERTEDNLPGLLPGPSFGVPVLAPREAFFAPHELVALESAAGRISAESIVVYPPGIANVLPGERFTEELIAYFAEMLARGCSLRGTWDGSTERVRVVRG